MKKRRNNFSRRRNGFTVVEAVICSVVVAVMLLAALRASSAAGLASLAQQERATASALADEMITAVARLDYENPDGTPSFGTEAGEVSAQKSTFDDIDDFNGWNESPPQNAAGSVLALGSTWRRTALVERVSAATLAVSGTETGVKRITVTVTRNGKVRATRVVLRTRSF